MKKYSYLELEVTSEIKVDLQSIIQTAIESFDCSGSEEFSLDEPQVDALLGDRSYSGGDVPASVIKEVEEKVTSESFRVRFYFYSDDHNVNAKSFEEYLNLNFQDVSVRLAEEEQEDWNQTWRDHYDIIEVSDGMRIVPSWKKEQKSDGDILIYPGQGFGTGEHETTFLCLQLFKDYVSETQSCLDFGCGSGILGIAVNIFHNPKIVDLYDIDSSALENTKQNIELNFAGNERATFRMVLPKNRDLLQSKYDLVFANILMNVLEDEMDNLIKKTENGGYLILSGLLSAQVDLLATKYLEFKNLHLIEKRIKGDWGAIIFQKQEDN